MRENIIADQPLEPDDRCNVKVQLWMQENDHHFPKAQRDVKKTPDMVFNNKLSCHVTFFSSHGSGLNLGQHPVSDCSYSLSITITSLFAY
jgi:hypothetical protein